MPAKISQFRLDRARRHAEMFCDAKHIAAADRVTPMLGNDMPQVVANPRVVEAAQTGLRIAHGQQRKPLSYPVGLESAIAAVCSAEHPGDTDAACEMAIETASVWMLLNQPRRPF